jgi:hypothetical protein
MRQLRKRRVRLGRRRCRKCVRLVAWHVHLSRAAQGGAAREVFVAGRSGWAAVVEGADESPRICRRVSFQPPITTVYRLYHAVFVDGHVLMMWLRARKAG